MGALSLIRDELVDAAVMDAANTADGRSRDDFAEHECTEIEPVCGCDNMTYENTCIALDAGVRVVKRGGC
ncbi:MAG: hypothetical protein RL701_4474 [Pseudomonadota bacterium]